MAHEELRSLRWKKLCADKRKTLPPVCWYCGEAIDLSLSGRDPWGWSLDHVIPRHIAPHLMWDESNLRPAHMHCNSTRGARPQTVNFSLDWK